MPWRDTLGMLKGHQQTFYSPETPAPAWLGSSPWASGALVQALVIADWVLIVCKAAPPGLEAS